MLQIDHLTKRFGDRLALDRVSLQIAPGEIYGLLGPNGAGKTTTINLICNLLRPDDGDIRIAGQPVSDRTKAWVGVTPQRDLLYGSLSCGENLEFLAQIYGVPRKLRRGRIDRCLELVGLSDRLKSPVETLSGGMQRRLSIAAALIHGPKLVVLDEPTTGLDVEARFEIWNLIRQLQQAGITVLLTTHLLDEAERLCQHIGVIRQGRLLAQGTLAELQQRWVPAQTLGIVQADDHLVEARARSLGWPTRHYGDGLVVWLPEQIGVRELLEKFDGIDVRSVAVQQVRLEQIYLEITQQADRAANPGAVVRSQPALLDHFDKPLQQFTP
jgi:ABC-2 type transport system ATP-binding protein